jgi:hypothetical protein
MSPVGSAGLVLAVYLLAADPAVAQPTTCAYAFGAPGIATGAGEAFTTLQGGAGIEARFPTGLGLGAEVAYVAPIPVVAAGTGVFSPGITLYSRPRDRYTTCFSAGYSLAFREFTSHGWHLGGGFEYSRRPGVALRVEVRDQIFRWDGTIHFLSVRVGATWRR